MSKKLQNHSQNAPKNFEDAVAELEQILTKIEGGDLGLEDSLRQYERGSFLIQYCRGVLNSAEKQIEVITKNSDGSVEVKPFEEGEGDTSSISDES